jgi:hypothetical protein
MSFKNSCVLENACWFFLLFSRAWIETELGLFQQIFMMEKNEMHLKLGCFQKFHEELGGASSICFWVAIMILIIEAGEM